jgi:hypothetical protein
LPGNAGTSKVKVFPLILVRLTTLPTPGTGGTVVDSDTPISSLSLLKVLTWFSTKRGNTAVEPVSLTIFPEPTRLAAGQASGPRASSSASEALHWGSAEVSTTAPGWSLITTVATEYGLPWGSAGLRQSTSVVFPVGAPTSVVVSAMRAL